MKLLVNNYERITHDRLLKACNSEDAHVCPKVRVKDAIPVERSGISGEAFGYALQSHFDFVVANNESDVLFAVEFDGESHRSPDVLRRDHLKNELCARFNLPLLRINANHLQKKFRQWDLLTYFIETWFLKRSFEKAQEAGSVPLEEDFDPLMFVTDGKGGRWPYWFCAPSQLAIQQLHAQSKLAHRTPSHVTGRDANDNIHNLAFIKVSESGWTTTQTGMRNQLFDVCDSEVVWQIGIVDLHDRLCQIIDGQAATQTEDEVGHIVSSFAKKYRPCSWGGIAEGPLTLLDPKQC